MADNVELKVKSFRIDDETNEKLREIMKNFPNQNLALQKMVEVYELEQGKEAIADRKEDIEEFEKYVSCLVRLYMSSLESNQNQKELIRSEFDSQIRTLKEKLETTRQERDEVTLKSKKYASENEALKQANERLSTEYKAKIEDLQDMLKEKEESNQLLKSAGTELKAKVEQMAVEEEQNKALHKELESLKAEHEKLMTSYRSLEADLSDLKVQHEQNIAQIQKTHSETLQRVKEYEQIKLDKALLELEKQHQEQIKQLNEQYQTKLMELWNTKQSNKKKNDKSNEPTETPIQQIINQTTKPTN